MEAVKNAEATKGRVDEELRDLEKTLKNIETARPFEDLTVVCIVLFMEMGRRKGMQWVRRKMWDRWLICVFNRMRLQLLDLRLMRRPTLLFLRDAGVFQVTRYVFQCVQRCESPN